jgi:hypothetical protein
LSPSSYQSRNFVISYYNRPALDGEWLGELDISMQNWRHSISAFGGFDTAQFSLVEGQNVMQDWIANGLGRMIVVYDDSLLPIWEGFVNSISVNQAGLSVTHGPMTDIANRIKAIYSGVDTSVYPPIIGVRKQTPTINNLQSQQLWGVWPLILSLAGVTDANADQLVDMYLTEHHHSEVNSSFSFNTADISLTVDCLGWQHTLNYPYNYTVLSGEIEISTRIQEVLEDHVNPSWLSSDYSRIERNTTLIKRYQNDDRLALEQLRGYTAMGDAANQRWLFGIYENRQAVYGPASNQIDYEIRLTDPRQLILDSAGSIVPAWRVRPGKLVFFSDFLPGLGAPYTDLHQDPRILQIESLQYDLGMPYAVQMTGGHHSKYEARSAKLGLRGTDV